MRGACPSVQFTLKGYLVTTTAATVYKKGNCKDLRDDRSINLTGTIDGAKNVTATNIEVK